MAFTGSKQVTINPSFYKKMASLEGKVSDAITRKGEALVTYAVNISPVDTGAYAESFSVKARGQGGGRSRTSHGKPKGVNAAAVKERQAARLRGEVRQIDPLETKGFTLRNRAPHANMVEMRHGVFRQTKGRFR